MMTEVKDTFEQRKAEIETYFVFLKNYKPKNADDNLFKILKSQLLLMLYNLIEFSISNAIEEIHKNIYDNQVSFNSLKIGIKSLIIDHTKRVKSDDFVKKITDIATDIVKHTFKKEDLFGGNIDGRKVRRLGDLYGFDSKTDYDRTGNGCDLFTIKEKRNDLTHGIFSFTEVGKEYTVPELESMKKKTINYLSDILDKIELYLDNKEYCEKEEEIIDK
jgi:hypothetical protein